MNYPTIEQINLADHEQICRWYRFLHSPVTDEQVVILTIIVVRFQNGGGFTPELPKKIGLKP